MAAEIYYFSGTGNSLFVAKELEKRISDSRLIPIVGLLNEKAVKTNGASIGIVFPVHALTIPVAVKRFLRAADFSSSEYLFAVATREGSIFRGFHKIDRLLRKKHRRLDSQFILNMCGSDPRPKDYIAPTSSEILSYEKLLLKKLDFIGSVVSGRMKSLGKDSGITLGFGYPAAVNYILEKIILFCMALSEHVGGVNYFYADSKCSGCGACEKVCLSGKIKMGDKKPLWQKNVLCYMCFACVNFCPNKSVQIKSIPGVKSCTAANGRYPHPYATAADISDQKKLRSDTVSVQ